VFVGVKNDWKFICSLGVEKVDFSRCALGGVALRMGGNILLSFSLTE
jgi:hypothetical protein